MATIAIGSSFNSDGIEKAQRDLDKLKNKTDSISSKLSKVGKVGFASISTFVGGAAGFAVAATSKLEDANVQLENGFKNAGTTVEEHKGKLAKVQEQMQKYGYSQAESASAISRMTTVTGSANKALDSMGLAADIAKNRHVDLEKAGDLLAKTMAGSTSAAKRMGVAIPDSVNKIQDPAKKSAAIMQILQGHFKGSAAAAADTFGGKMEATKAKLSDAASSIGSKLIPVVMNLVGKLMQLGNWIGSHKEVLIGIIVAIGLALGTMAVMWIINTIAAMAFWTAATGGIILLVGAVVAGVLYMWKHFAWFRTAVMVVWKGIQIVIHVAWAVIKGIFHAIAWYVTNIIVPAFQFLWGAIKFVWDMITGAISFAWGIIKTVFGWITDGVNALVDVFSGIVSGVGDAFGKIGDAMWNGFKVGLNFVISGINTLIHGFNKITGTVSFGLIPSIPDIPELRALGGSVRANKPYIVGERGPELFVPGGSGTIVPNNRLGGGDTIIQHITITSNDPQQVVNALIRYQQRNGSVPIKVR